MREKINVSMIVTYKTKTLKRLTVYSELRSAPLFKNAAAASLARRA
jgi:hypothetical protein